MPPAFAAANDSTRTPNRSSFRLTPASAPLRANTKVPVRSRTIGSFSMMRPSDVNRTSELLIGPFEPAFGRGSQALERLSSPGDQLRLWPRHG
jgi:hypothetical protein